MKKFILILALTLVASPSFAQFKKISLIPTPVAKPTTTVDPIQKFMNDLSTIKTEVVDGVITDLQAADTDAATLTNTSDPTSFRDPISHACYPAAEKFLQSLPVATPTTGTFVLIQLFQKKRDFVMQIQAGLPLYLKMGCAPLLGDEAAIFTKIMGMVGVNVALNSLIPGSGVLNSLALPTL